MTIIIMQPTKKL